MSSFQAMRNFLACIIIVPALAVVGCGDKRENMGVAVDRGGHSAGEDHGSGGIKVLPGKNEVWYTMVAGDTLYSVAKMYNVELGWLIKRNHITTPVKPGQQLIVPARSTGGGGAVAKPAAKPAK